MTLAVATTPKRSSRADPLCCDRLAARGTLFWAGNHIVGAGAVESIDPLSLVLLRWSLALVPLLAIAQLVERPQWRQVLAGWPWLIALSAFGLLGHPYTFAQLSCGVIFVAGILLTSAGGPRGGSQPFFWRRRRAGNLEP
ncbi:EamA family transporter [Arthrobacter sp. NPDC056691]|uniref:EamA family transporter n=1 Tax=Arthrobacter sp. NPDC056691 TaxID=3345913 RepID=UPI00366DD567